MKMIERERRDLGLFALILPIGVALMLGAGQFAIQLLPQWNVSASMGSQMDPNQQYAALEDGKVIEPVMAAILTPPAWRDTFLTPQAGQKSGDVIPLATFDPSETASPEAIVTQAASQTAAASPIASESPTPVPTETTTATSPAVTATSTEGGTLPTATKTEKPGQDDDPPPATASPTPPPVVSTLDPALTPVSSSLPGFNTGAPDGSSAQGTCSSGCFKDGSFFILDKSANPIHVNPTPDGYYEMVYYEVENPVGSHQIAIDQVILGITNDWSGNTYYEVFNWGDGKRDTNTNVDTNLPGIPTPEVDNAVVATSDLYRYSASPASPPALPDLQTGILIDVDTAPSNPPPGDYKYVVVIAPANQPAGPSTDGGQVDAIQVTEVPIP